MSGDAFMATLLSEDSNGPVAQASTHIRCIEEDSLDETLTFHGLGKNKCDDIPHSISEKDEKDAAKSGPTLPSDVIVEKTSMDQQCLLNSNEEEVSNQDAISLTEGIADSTVIQVSEKSPDITEVIIDDSDGLVSNQESEVQASNLTESSKCNGISPSESKLPSEGKELRETQKYRESDSSDDDTSSSDFSLDSASDCSDSFLEKMHKNSTPNKIVNIKTKGELDLDELPPIEDLTITVKESEMQKVGSIYAIVDKLVIVRALKDLQPLDLDSVLFLSYDNPLGRIFDVFGPVVEPFYSIRFNSTEHIADKSINKDADVFFAPDKTDITSYVFVDQLKKQKGSDASWQDNNEPPEEHLDYSDDEQEKIAIHKRKAKNRNRIDKDDDIQVIPHKIPHNTQATPSTQRPRDILNAHRSSSQQHHNKPLMSNPFFAPYTQASSQRFSIPSFAKPTMAEVMTSKYSNAIAKINDSQNLTPQRPNSQTSGPPSPFRFQAHPIAQSPTVLAPPSLFFQSQQPFQSFPARPQQPFMVQSSASPVPMLQHIPVFGQVAQFPPMSSVPVQNQVMVQPSQMLPFGYPSLSSPNFIRQAPVLTSQAPNFVSQNTNFTRPLSQAPFHSNQAASFFSQTANFIRPPVSPSPSFVNQANFVSQAPNFVSQAPTYVNQASVPVLVQNSMVPQWHQRQNVVSSNMGTVPLRVNIPTSLPPNAIHPFVHQSSGLLNVMPPTQNFAQNRF